MFIAALFKISNTWKQPRYPSVGKWISKLNCGMYKQWNYFSVLKRNELSSHENSWRNLKCILLRKKLLWKNYLLYDYNYMTSRKGKTLEPVKRAVVSRRWECMGGDEQAEH